MLPPAMASSLATLQISHGEDGDAVSDKKESVSANTGQANTSKLGLDLEFQLHALHLTFKACPLPTFWQAVRTAFRADEPGGGWYGCFAASACLQQTDAAKQL